jgi:hypothetical protein
MWGMLEGEKGSGRGEDVFHWRARPPPPPTPTHPPPTHTPARMLPMHRRRAIESMYAANVSNWSIDLMCGLPELTEEGWEASLKRALDADPSHVSIYDLQVSGPMQPMGRCSGGPTFNLLPSFLPHMQLRIPAAPLGKHACMWVHLGARPHVSKQGHRGITTTQRNMACL